MKKEGGCMNNEVNAEMKEFWNGEGGKRWVGFQEKLDASLKPFGRATMETATLSAGERVIEIGCGCGDNSIEMASRVGPEGRVHGIDISEPILERARAQSAMKNNLSFECGDAQTHGFETSVFDIAFSRFGVMFFDDPATAFGNIRSTLKPDGRLAFTCWRTVKDNEWVHLPLGGVANHLPLPPPPGANEPGPFSFGDPERVKDILQKAGFIDIAIKKFNAPFKVGENLDDAVSFLTQLGPANAAITEADPDETTRTRIAKDLRNALTPYDTGQGVVIDGATWIVNARNS